MSDGQLDERSPLAPTLSPSGEREPGPELDLETLLSPLSIDVFFDEHWEKAPLILGHRAPDHYRGLLSSSDVEALVGSGVLRYPQLRLVKDDRIHPAQTFSRPDGTIDLPAVHREHASGATIVLPDLDRSWEPLHALCRRLEARFSRRVWANAYLTPPESCGFFPHYDTHDVLILQISGTKEWRIYDAPVALPRNAQPYDPSYLESAQLLRETTFEPGDVAYIPRGHIHAARSLASASLHVTVAIDVFTWTDLLLAAVDRASRRDVSLRRSVPTGATHGTVPAPRVADELARKLQALATDAALGDVVDAVSGTLLQSPSPESPPDGERLQAHSLVRRNPLLEARLVSMPESVVLVYRGGQMKGPKHIEPALRFMIEATGSFRIDALPGDLGDAARLLLVRRLVRDGFLSILLYGESPGGP
ncbi:MAG: hypothetical protein IT379_18300 [Deltaproteobacteria bacterium]|nr:hypothetical protein [Deltaproteobacteria bacterium]